MLWLRGFDGLKKEKMDSAEALVVQGRIYLQSDSEKSVQCLGGNSYPSLTCTNALSWLGSDHYSANAHIKLPGYLSPANGFRKQTAAILYFHHDSAPPFDITGNNLTVICH